MSRSGRGVSAGLVAGALLLALSAGAAVTGPPIGATLDALAQPPARAAIASQRIYFVMTDRYANGDTSNDAGGYDPTDPGMYHGGDFKGLTGDCTDARHGLARIKDLGFNAIWVTPPVRQKTVQGSSAAYHGYWGLDFTRVDPHLGTDQDFADFVACAHRLGLKVYLDVVVNHTADVITLTGSGYVSPEEIPYRDCHGKRFNPARYTRRRFPCLNAANMPRVPVVLPEDRNAKKPAWLNNPTRYHDRGDIDFGSCNQVCFEQGDFFGLDDLFTEQPAVMNGLAAVYGDWIRRYEIDGFRVDTARHVNAAFFRLWVPKILAAARAAGVADFQIFGEVAIGDDIELSGFVRNRRLPNVLDFPFQDAAAGLAAGETSARAIASRLADDDYFQGAVAPTPPTFLGNHDMGRAALMIKQRSRAEGNELLRRVLLGYDLLYLLRGAPVVYYGDEVGMIGQGGDKEARQDMFPTKVADWKTQERVGSPPIGNGSSFDDVDNPIEVRLRQLGALRDGHPALSTGATAIRLVQRGVLVVSRFDAAARREYVAAFNSGTASARVTFPTATPSSAWTGILSTSAHPSSGADGRLTLDVPGTGAMLLRADTDLPVRAPGTPALKVGRDDFTNLWRLGATVPGSAPVSVAFAVKRGKGAWRRLAADDSPPYRAFVDPSRYRRQERIQLVAIVRALDGRTAVSKVASLRVRR